MIYIILFLEFFKVGLFSIGGGLATLPFLYQLADKYPWFTSGEVADMLAISESTPGPIGINMATYAGFEAAGVFGGIIATLGLVAPSIIIILLIARVLKKFRENKIVDDSFYGLRAVVIGLICYAAWQVVSITLFDFGSDIVLRWKECILFAILLPSVMFLKKVHPVAWVAIAAACGIIFQFPAGVL